MSHVRSFRCLQCGKISPVDPFFNDSNVLMTLEDDTGLECMHCEAHWDDEIWLTIFSIPLETLMRQLKPMKANP